MSAGFSQDGARRIAAFTRRMEATPQSSGGQSSRGKPLSPPLEGFLLTDLTFATRNGTVPATAQFRLYRGEGSGWGPEEVVTLVNRSIRYAAKAGDYQLIETVNGELRPIPQAYGTYFYDPGGQVLDCDPFACTGSASNLQTFAGACSPGADVWSFLIYPGPSQGGAICDSNARIWGAHGLAWSSGCTWAETPYLIGGQYAQWTLAIDTANACTLTLTIGGVPQIVYTLPGDEWCSLCSNSLDGCGLTAPPICAGMPSRICVKPSLADFPCAAICPGGVPADWKLTATGFSGSACCLALNGVWVLRGTADCQWDGPDIAPCTCPPVSIGGIPYTPIGHWSLSLGGSPVSPQYGLSIAGALWCGDPAATFSLQPARCVDSNTLVFQSGVTCTEPGTVLIEPL